MGDESWKQTLGPQVIAFRVRDRLTGIHLDALEVGVDFMIGDKLLKAGSIVVKCPIEIVDLDGEEPPVCQHCGETAQNVLLWYGPGSHAFREEYQTIS